MFYLDKTNTVEVEVFDGNENIPGGFGDVRQTITTATTMLTIKSVKNRKPT